MSTLSTRGNLLDIEVRAGVTVGPCRVTVSSEDGVVNLTDCTITGLIKRNTSSNTSIPITTDIVDADAGVFTFTIPSTVTDTLTGTYIWEMELVYSDDSVRELYYGRIIVSP